MSESNGWCVFIFKFVVVSGMCRMGGGVMFFLSFVMDSTRAILRACGGAFVENVLVFLENVV